MFRLNLTSTEVETRRREVEEIFDRVAGYRVEEPEPTPATGPGLFEFASYGNTTPYTPESNGIDKLVSAIEEVWFDRVQKPLPVIATGTAGCKHFDAAIKEMFESGV